VQAPSSWLPPPLAARQPGPELMDTATDITPEELAETLAQLRLINRRLGGYATTRRALDDLLARTGRPAGEWTVLDVGGGSGDAAPEILAWGRSRGVGVRGDRRRPRSAHGRGSRAASRVHGGGFGALRGPLRRPREEFRRRPRGALPAPLRRRRRRARAAADGRDRARRRRRQRPQATSRAVDADPLADGRLLEEPPRPLRRAAVGRPRVHRRRLAHARDRVGTRPRRTSHMGVALGGERGSLDGSERRGERGKNGSEGRRRFFTA